MDKLQTEETPRAKKRYAHLKTYRYEYLENARLAARLTVPNLMPPEGFDGGEVLPSPNHGLGGRGVKHLSSKLLLTMFPTTAPFFKYAVDELLVEQMTDDPELRGEIDKALSSRERAIHNEIATTKFRPIAFEAMRQLLVSGNYLLHIPRKGGVRGWRLDKFVTLRDDEGNLLEIVIEETFVKETLPEKARELIEEETREMPSEESSSGKVDLYTHVYREGNKFKTYQEVDGKVIPGTEGSYPLDRNEFIALRLTAVPGDAYGRSYIDEMLGDLTSLDVLEQSFVEGCAIAARTIFGIQPGSSVRPNVLQKVPNGGFFMGEQGSIWSLQTDKRVDYQTTESKIQDIEQRLAFSFLLNSAIQRSGERVTAEEIRTMVSEIEDGLGGMYSLLAEEFQLPVVKLFESRMENSRGVPGLPKGAASPKVVTGLDALGRGHDNQALDSFAASITQTLGPETVQQLMNPTEYIKRKAAAIGVDTSGLIKTDEAIQQEQQQQQLLQLVQHLGPNAINQAGPLLAAAGGDPSQLAQLAGQQPQQTPEEPPQNDG